ncbi:hypothetical protein SAMN02745127_02366 [Oceanospirillum multiglobuliferum]|uniref:Uncharacterized protein n=1 Tax=Oceanospirillum multiglobuliferum TaxID=64969 RepID=A0A1T4RG91_9GAMM|nr:hypothetical protein [Oceanospirillum multiglobuliferum]OPX54872.1 hypothetical protein BTE48_11670 [Oceanospirillum multiglobuliferum]SKA15060.1 hypothetical protein SAMN02745127_02366 [Oceanospirillum multiglobuliferum]
MTDLYGLNAELYFMYGDPRELAKWIRQGGEITPSMRLLIADALDGSQKKRPGQKRTWEKQMIELEIVQRLEYMELLYQNKRGYKTKALEAIAENLGISVEALKLYRKNIRCWRKQQFKGSE